MQFVKREKKTSDHVEFIICSQHPANYYEYFSLSLFLPIREKWATVNYFLSTQTTQEVKTIWLVFELASCERSKKKKTRREERKSLTLRRQPNYIILLENNLLKKAQLTITSKVNTTFFVESKTNPLEKKTGLGSLLLAKHASKVIISDKINFSLIKCLICPQVEFKERILSMRINWFVAVS